MAELKILMVDDDVNICELVRLYLEKENYKVLCVYDGDTAIKEAENFAPDLIILDLMLPKTDGINVCRKIRETNDVPIIMLTAKGETFDKVLGLEMGADDYIIKPFEPRELTARVKAVLRRYNKKDEQEKTKTVEFDGLSINLMTYQLVVGDKTMEIPPKEMELLYFMASHPNRVFTREQLLEAVWDFDYFGDSRTVDVHIKRLREKLEGNEKNWGLKTVWGVGYKFEVKKVEP